MDRTFNSIPTSMSKFQIYFLRLSLAFYPEYSWKTPFVWWIRPKLRFDITAKFESERRAEQSQTHRRIDENRGHLIDAAIVRVMKMRKTLKYQSLIAEVLAQLSSKFTPKVPQIKVKFNAIHSELQLIIINWTNLSTEMYRKAHRKRVPRTWFKWQRYL